jgi:hypothetical protein
MSARGQFFMSADIQAIPGFRRVISVLEQPPEMGVLPILRAATDPAVLGGEFYGPHSLLEDKGLPGAGPDDPNGPQ